MLALPRIATPSTARRGVLEGTMERRGFARSEESHKGEARAIPLDSWIRTKIAAEHTKHRSMYFSSFNPRSFPALTVLLSICFAGTIEVSAWVPAANWYAPNAVGISFRRSSFGSSSYGGSILCSTLEDAIETPPPEPSTEQQLFSVPLPKLKYTVPGTKRGWKENGVWMDKDGPRNGPPQNFWRQMGDERLYEGNLELVMDLLQLDNFRGSSALASNAIPNPNASDATRLEDMVSGIAERLERTNSIRIPSLNRLILGDWAPIVRGGRIVATANGSGHERVSVPYCVRIERTHGQKLAPKTPYGTFDEHLEPDEELTVRELSGSGGVVASGTVRAPGDKHEVRTVERYCHDSDSELCVGGITYITKYVMIMRESPTKDTIPGPVTEVWIRVDGEKQ